MISQVIIIIPSDTTKISVWIWFRFFGLAHEKVINRDLAREYIRLLLFSWHQCVSVLIVKYISIETPASDAFKRVGALFIPLSETQK